MRIGIGQINTIVGDLRGNIEKIVEYSQLAADEGCDLLVTPELAITGYPPQDLLFKDHFIADQFEQMVSVLAGQLMVPTIVGFVDRRGDSLFNAAALISGRKIKKIIHKTLLPTYDVFDEWRYFKPASENQPFDLEGEKLGVTICEDLWDEGYDAKVVKRLVAQGATIIINISSSPFHCGKYRQRIDLCADHARANSVPVVYCNLVGAQDELIFDGNSFAVDACGELVKVAAAFREELLVFDSEEAVAPLNVPERSREMELFKALETGTADYFSKCGFKKAVLGLSGGVDSALVACIAAEALGPENVLCVSMPSRYTSQASNDDARTLAENLGVQYCVLPIEESIKVATGRFTAEFGDYQQQVTVENLQARERGKILMEISNDQGALVLATGNKTEYALGYSTLYGDMCGGLAVIGDVSKPDVYRLSRYYNKAQGREVIPDRILTREPSAELREDQVDPFDYDKISPLVDCVIEEHASRQELLDGGYKAEDIDLVFRLVRLNEYKRRQAPPILRVTEKAFGLGRKMPIVNRYRY